MLYYGNDPESYTTEHTSACEDEMGYRPKLRVANLPCTRPPRLRSAAAPARAKKVIHMGQQLWRKGFARALERHMDIVC